MPFPYRFLHAPIHGGFRMDDYWVWCGSVIRGEDGLYHMFASRWPHAYPFYEGYRLASEVVRAVAACPEGPYEFREIILPPRGEQHWDGRMTHNPVILRRGRQYLLFYIGATFAGPLPSAEQMRQPRSAIHPVTGRVAIGLATSDSILGPWTRRDQPVLSERPGE